MKNVSAPSEQKPPLDAISVPNQKNLIKDVSLHQLSKNKKFQKFMANIFTTERNKKSDTFSKQ